MSISPKLTVVKRRLAGIVSSASKGSAVERETLPSDLLWAASSRLGRLESASLIRNFFVSETDRMAVRGGYKGEEARIGGEAPDRPGETGAKRRYAGLRRPGSPLSEHGRGVCAHPVARPGCRRR